MLTLDNQLMLWLNYDGGAWQDAFWWGISNKFTWVALYLTLVVLLIGEAWRLGRLNGRQLALLVVCTAVCILLSDQLSSGLIKPLVQRPRPSHQPGLMEALHYVGDYRGGPFGFVSSHAANTVALCTWLGLLLRTRLSRSLMLTFVLWVIFNCYSRIYLGVHYPGDIICGALVGALAGWLTWRLYAALLPRLFPTLYAEAEPTGADAPLLPAFLAKAQCWPALVFGLTLTVIAFLAL